MPIKITANTQRSLLVDEMLLQCLAKASQPYTHGWQVLIQYVPIMALNFLSPLMYLRFFYNYDALRNRLSCENVWQLDSRIWKAWRTNCIIHVYLWYYIYHIYIYISMGYCKKDVAPLQTHWSCVFLALAHRYVYIVPLSNTICSRTTDVWKLVYVKV